MKKFSLFERSAHTLENYIDGPIGAMFYDPKYLDGLCQRRNEVHAKLAKTGGATIVMTTMLAYFDSLENTIKISGVNLTIAENISSALSVVVAFGLLGTVFSLFDQMLIDRYIRTIGYKAKIFSFDLVLLDRTAINLWSDAVTPRYFGPVSKVGHKAAFVLFGIFSTPVLFIMFIYPIITCSIVFVSTLERENTTLIEYILSTISISTCAFTVFAVAIFNIRYKFDDAELNEADGSPTAEFLARIQEEENVEKTGNLQGE